MLAVSDAYAVGEAIGMLIGVAVVIGIVVFAIIALIKAFTRRTTGWIIAGTIGGLILSVPVLLVVIGMIIGLSSARKSSGTRSAVPPRDSTLRTAATPPLVAPSSAQTVRGSDLSYTLTLPPEWTAKRKVEDFDVLASRKSLYVGVIAEEGSLGTPETIATIAREKIKSTGTDLRWSEPTQLLLDGRSWLQFMARCKVDTIPVTYQFYVYSGDEGTFQVVGWTTQDLYDRDAGLMRDVMRTFRFPR